MYLSRATLGSLTSSVSNMAASPWTEPSESVRRCDDRVGEPPSRSGDPGRDADRVAVGERTNKSPNGDLVLERRSGVPGSAGRLGDIASREGEGGSIFWMGDSLRRASMAMDI